MFFEKVLKSFFFFFSKVFIESYISGVFTPTTPPSHYPPCFFIFEILFSFLKGNRKVLPLPPPCFFKNLAEGGGGVVGVNTPDIIKNKYIHCGTLNSFQTFFKNVSKLFPKTFFFTHFFQF